MQDGIRMSEEEKAKRLAEMVRYQWNFGDEWNNKWLDTKPTYPTIYGYKTPNRSKF